ncbi:Pre-mRNA-processing factor 17 [Spathaspora sp. JA1]|nr:Pre-mRNA-processing factor 17 [Spathaspora sp. JA1]
MSIVNYGSDSESESESERLNSEGIVIKKQRIAQGHSNKLYIDETSFKYNSTQQAQGSAKQLAKELKRKRKKGPWGGYSDQEKQQEEEEAEADASSPVPEEVEELAHEASPSAAASAAASSKFVGSKKLDYLGRSYMYSPKLPTPTTCFTPKQVIHQFPAHDHGINKLALFPESGHLLLTCGNDSLIKLWSVSTRELLRIFMGHSSAVKDITFNSNGTQFLSCGFDRIVNLWDTETGEILHTYKLPALPNCILFHQDKEFLVGLNNNIIQHYDLSGQLLQTYDHHQGGINTLVHISTTTFMSTSQDKTVRMWNYGINIPIKTISSHLQHSMPTAVVHPTANYIALQSMDNSIRVIHSLGKFKYKRDKVFQGHHCSGYGIEIAISHDGRIIMSGDTKGYGYFWDWKSGKLINKIKCGGLIKEINGLLG